MRAKLLLTVREEEMKELEERDILHLYLVIEGKMSYDLIYYPTVVDSNDKEKYFDALGDAINTATIIMNAIPGLKLVVDQPICEFIEGSEEETKNFVKQLIIEI